MSSVRVDPLMDAGPAKEMTTGCHYWLMTDVVAYVAFEVVICRLFVFHFLNLINNL